LNYSHLICDLYHRRSSYFQRLLAEQEAESKPLASNGPSAAWRSPITINEESPFEAAAFLESLHEGRTLFKGEWNVCWARLSVCWGVDDLVLEYAHMIESHTNKLINIIQNNHWRTNPNVLSGMKVAVMRKGATPVPTIVLGICVEAAPGTGYSKVRVAFDIEKKATETTPVLRSPIKISKQVTDENQRALQSLPPTKPDYPQSPSFTRNLAMHKSSSPGRKIIAPESSDPLAVSGSYPSQPPPILPMLSTQRKVTLNAADTISVATPTQIFIGDIGEPFWIQATHEGASWMDADDYFLFEAKRLITTTDKRVFWEMIRTLIELPDIASRCNTDVKKTKEFLQTLKRVENRVLWTHDGPYCLPKDIALELLTSCYVIPSSHREI
jgi:hypothetical protein